MRNNFDSLYQQFFTLPPKKKILYVQKVIDRIVNLMYQRQTQIELFLEEIAIFKTLISRLFRLSGVYKKEYFDFLIYSIQKLWEALEKCTSQFMLYPALSAFIDLFSKLKGLNPYYTLHAALEGTISYGKIPPKRQIIELLEKEKQDLTFLIDYMQLESVLRLNLSEKEKIEIVKSATNYAQLLVLMLYNFLITVPVIPKENFLSWTKLFEESIEKARLGHFYLNKLQTTVTELLRIKISESSLSSLNAQLYLLKARFLNENVSELLNLSYMENTRALQILEPLFGNKKFREKVESYYFQQKTLLLETRFYQILYKIVNTQYKGIKHVGDRKDEKPELTNSIVRKEVEEILNEIENYIRTLLEKSRKESIGISFNLINIFAKISFGAYLYDLADNVGKMEELIKIKGIDIGDPELSLLLARYWLFKWGKNKDESSLIKTQNYFERAAEVYEMLYNNRYVPIYCFSMLMLIQLTKKNYEKAEVFLMKADDVFNDAKYLKIINDSEEYYYELFREQIDQILLEKAIDQPIRFDKPFNVLDFNSWLVETKDWRRRIKDLPEPFPFHLDQLKILEFEFKQSL
ncbi:MAG: hypothetical protein ACTSSF_10070 [Candidatus Heimdallarchaeaceae archaeon]